MHLSHLLENELAVFTVKCGRSDLSILETGSIRGETENYHADDGWSTLTFAQHVREHGGYLHSVDLDIRAASVVLEKHELRRHATLIEGHSIDVLAGMLVAGEPMLDVALLDSDNDSDLILHEYLLVRRLLRRPGLLLVDDVDLDSTGVVKGHKIVPWFDRHGLSYRIEHRDGGAYSTGVLVAEI